MGATASFLKRQERTTEEVRRGVDSSFDRQQNPPIIQRPIIRSRSVDRNLQFVCNTCERIFPNDNFGVGMRCPTCNGNIINVQQRRSVGPRLFIRTHSQNPQSQSSIGNRITGREFFSSSSFQDETLQGLPLNNDEILFNLVYFASSEVANREEHDRQAKAQAMTEYIHALSSMQSTMSRESTQSDESVLAEKVVKSEAEIEEESNSIYQTQKQSPEHSDEELKQIEECAVCSELIYTQPSSKHSSDETMRNEGRSIVGPHVKLPECGHSFHTSCVLRWLVDGNPTCPICRTTVVCPTKSDQQRQPLDEGAPIATLSSEPLTTRLTTSMDAEPNSIVVAENGTNIDDDEEEVFASPSMITAVTRIENIRVSSVLPTVVAQLT